MIDTHLHVISDDLTAYPSRIPHKTRERLASAPCTTPGVLELMDRGGVRAATLAQSMSTYGDDNSYAVDSGAAHPDRFVPVVYISPRNDPGARLAYWAERGAGGVRISAGAGIGVAHDFDETGVATLIDESIARGIAVQLQVLFHELDQVHHLLERRPEQVVAIDHCASPTVEVLADGPPYSDSGAAHPLRVGAVPRCVPQGHDDDPRCRAQGLG